ncbi:hypothetical protein M569_12989, partial [Genlisea aurea]
MEKHVQVFLNRLSVAAIGIATVIVLLLYVRTPETCFDPSDPHPKPHTRFPRSTCDFSHRPYSSVENRNRRLWSTKSWIGAVSSYSALFATFYSRDYVANRSRVLIVSAGAGQAVQALKELGAEDVTAVEIVESPPLVSRADPHNLPYFDGSFDLGVGLYLDRALYPKRYAAQIERTVRGGGYCVVSVEDSGEDRATEVAKLFQKSRFVDSRNVILAGERRKAIV